ncbi:MAG: nucleotidyltransferase family protein [Nitriliruptoraceae bacterium]|nr:nucleotidyltransferase family protein [Nitriliruptoraceae bacterium]
MSPSRARAVPELDPAGSTVLSQHARRVATYGLPGHPADIVGGAAATSAAGSTPLSAAEFDALLAEVTHHRIPGLLMAAVDDGGLAVTPAQRDRVAAAHLDACSEVLGLERLLLQTAEVLDTAGVRVVVLKGPAHAHLCYPDPSLRHFGDIDLLVPSAQLATARAALEHALGMTRQDPELRRGFDARYGKSITLKAPAGDIDLHRTLVFGTFAFAIDEAVLFRDTSSFTLAGRRFEALCPEARLLHIAYHAGLGDRRPRGSSLRDLAQQWLTGDHDPAAVRELAVQWRSEAVLAHGLTRLRRTLDARIEDGLASWCDRRVTRSYEARAIASYVGPNHGHAAKVRASLPFIDGPIARLRFLASNLLPGHGYLARQVASRRQWLSRGWRSIRGRKDG